jgi:hypothetical protein
VRATLFLAAMSALLVGVLGPAHAAGGQESSPADAAPRAAASTPIGQVGTGACSIAAPAAVVIDTQGAGAPSYVVPAGGVLTSFSHQANNVAGQVQAIVFADGPSSVQKTVAAKSAKLPVIANQLNTFPVRLPVSAGQRLGLGFTVNGMACATSGVPGDTTLVESPFDPDTTSTFVAQGVLSSPGVTFRPNISAVLEPDADGDGFGDLTQDGCPLSAHIAAACPDTAITKKPRHKSTQTRIRVTVKFVASIAGSTFECKLDGHKKWKTCLSPYKRKLGIGKHELRVRAVSPAGVPDPDPATVRFKIKRK